MLNSTANQSILNHTNSSNATATYNGGFQLGSFLLVSFMAAIGGLLIQLLNGLTIPKFLCFKGLKLKALFGRVHFPLLIGMVLGGIVARNYFGIAVLAYQEKWGGYLREVCVCILLMRGGLLI
jgi:hypothetical protein